jgi:hypothetical protein
MDSDEVDLHKFLDPITLDVMIDPVIAADGLTYDRNSIVTWFNTQRKSSKPLTSPLTNLRLQSDRLIPNDELKREYRSYLSSKSTIRIEDIRLNLTAGIHDELDKLANMKLIEELKLQFPKLIVIGNESHGKSTVLERIIGLPLFPREKGICTRCVIRVHLRRCNPNEAAIAEITTRPVSSNLTSEGASVLAALDNIRQKVQEVMNDLVNADRRKRLILDDQEIIVKIKSPSCLNMDVVDVPGLVMTIPPGETQNLPEVTHNLAQRIVKQENNSSIFLLVNDVRVPPNQSRSCAIIQQAKVENQTLGVLTKLDTFISEEGNEVEELTSLLSGTAKYSFPVGGGWMATASKKVGPSSLKGSIKPLEELQLLAETNKQEEQIFNTKYRTVYESMKDCLGIESIRNRIRQLYEGYLEAHWMPGLREHWHKLMCGKNLTGELLESYNFLTNMMMLPPQLVRKAIDKECFNILGIIIFCFCEEKGFLSTFQNSKIKGYFDKEIKTLLTKCVLELHYSYQDVAYCIVRLNCTSDKSVELALRYRTLYEFCRIDLNFTNEDIDQAIGKGHCENLRSIIIWHHLKDSGSTITASLLAPVNPDKVTDECIMRCIHHCTVTYPTELREILHVITGCTRYNEDSVLQEVKKQGNNKYYGLYHIKCYAVNILKLPEEFVDIAIRGNRRCKNLFTIICYVVGQGCVPPETSTTNEYNPALDYQLKELIQLATQESGYSLQKVLECIAIDKCQTVEAFRDAIQRREPKPSSNPSLTRPYVVTKQIRSTKANLENIFATMDLQYDDLDASPFPSSVPCWTPAPLSSDRRKYKIVKRNSTDPSF